MRKLSFMMLALMFSCQENEADRPELLTKPAQQIGTTSAVLEAEVTEAGPIKPITIGFLWGTTNDLTLATASNKHIIGQTSDKGPFSIKLEPLAPNTTYYYRAYASDTGVTQVYYGGIVSFTTLP